MTQRRLFPYLRILSVASAATVLSIPATVHAAAKVTIVNNDGPGEGFNDPTPVVPVGGNPGTTLGQQRLIAFQYAADLWGATLDSNVEIDVRAAFDPLGPNTLGSAGTFSVVANFPGVGSFPGAAFVQTWYPSALADKRAGTELIPGQPDINARFSSDFNFYLGLDNNHGALNDLVVVVLHELAHGLGYLSLVDPSTGQNFRGMTDIFSQFTLDTADNTVWSDYGGSGQRKDSALRVDGVVWNGSASFAAVPHVLSFGRPELTFNTPPVLGSPVRVGTASFGPALTAGGVTGDVVLGLDGSTDPAPTGTVTDACQPLTNAAAVAGHIALVDRGTCTFVVKVANAQAAGAIAVLVADNVAGDPPAGLVGVDPTIAIPAVRITLADGNAIKAQLALATTVNVTLALDLTRRAGADPNDRPQLFATNPVQPGVVDFPLGLDCVPQPADGTGNQPDLTHEVIPPFDMTLTQFRDVGWFLDADLNGVVDQTVILGTCNTGLPNVVLSNGATLADQARVWFRVCSGAKNANQFATCVGKLTNDAKKDGLITTAQMDAISACASPTIGTQ
jgi:PA domain